jgi:hypothetical protein
VVVYRPVHKERDAVTIREWQGQRSDVPIIGDHLLVAQNISFDVQGQVSRRAGLTFLSGTGARSMIGFGAKGQKFLVQVDSDGVVEAVVL